MDGCADSEPVRDDRRGGRWTTHGFSSWRTTPTSTRWCASGWDGTDIACVSAYSGSEARPRACRRAESAGGLRAAASDGYIRTVWGLGVKPRRASLNAGLAPASGGSDPVPERKDAGGTERHEFARFARVLGKNGSVVWQMPGPEGRGTAAGAGRPRARRQDMIRRIGSRGGTRHAQLPGAAQPDAWHHHRHQLACARPAGTHGAPTTASSPTAGWVRQMTAEQVQHECGESLRVRTADPLPHTRAA